MSTDLEAQTIYFSTGECLLADGRALASDQAPLTVAFHEDVGLT
jgi:hypothetical protein